MYGPLAPGYGIFFGDEFLLLGGGEVLFNGEIGFFNGEIGAEVALDYVADYSAGERLGGDGFCVGGGQLEAVEEDGGALGVDAVAGEGGDEERDGDLDGFGVFEDGEVDFDEVGGGDVWGGPGDRRVGLDHEVLALVDAGVEVAEVTAG